VKNREEAESETYREAVWNWYTDVAYPRLERGGALILIMTRWHEDDLAGRLLAEQNKGGDRWEVLSLPALDSEERPLWPEKFGREALEHIRLNIGYRAWDALYMQKPTAQEGSILKRQWWRRYSSPPSFSYKVQACQCHKWHRGGRAVLSARGRALGT
jgi:hypothetical protein